MRIVILVYESNEANHIVHRLVTACPSSIAALVTSRGEGSRSRLASTMKRLVADGGWGFVAPKTAEVVGYQLLSRWSPRRSALSPSVEEVARSRALPFMSIGDVNSEENVERLRELDADLFVSIHFDQILKSRVLALPRLGTLNVHGSLLPRNRGLFPYFWALANGDDATGVTVHWIDVGIDTGKIIAQVETKISPGDTVAGVARRCSGLGAELLTDVVRGIEDTGVAPGGVDQDGDGNYVSWPDRASVRRLRENGYRYGPLLRRVETPSVEI